MVYTRKLKRTDFIVNFVVPIYNEEKNINNLFLSLYSAIKYARINRWKIYFILNKSTDASRVLLEKLRTRFPKNILILKVNLFNKTASQKVAIKKIKNNGIIIFIDCDVRLDKRALIPIISKFEKNKESIILGGTALPHKPKNIGFYRSIMFYCLNVANSYPKILMPKYGSINLDGNKNYFHGRFFALRSKNYWILKEERFPEDVIFIDMIYQKFGTNGTFFNLTNSKCYYQPYLSLHEHYTSHLRNYFFLKSLYITHPDLSKFGYLYENTLNYNYISKLPKSTIVFILIWLFISRLESLIYYLNYNINKHNVDGMYLWRKMKSAK